MNLTEATREAIILAIKAGGLDDLGMWQDKPSVHTRRPVPVDARYPAIVISSNISKGDQDLMRTHIPVIVRDIVIYGEGDRESFRKVENLADEVFNLFHRNKEALPEIEGFRVIDIVASGPIPGPTDDQSKVARIVSLIIRLQRSST